jgi:hypothetical protein
MREAAKTRLDFAAQSSLLLLGQQGLRWDFKVGKRKNTTPEFSLSGALAQHDVFPTRTLPAQVARVVRAVWFSFPRDHGMNLFSSLARIFSFSTGLYCNSHSIY